MHPTYSTLFIIVNTSDEPGLRYDKKLGEVRDEVKDGGGPVSRSVFVVYAHEILHTETAAEVIWLRLRWCRALCPPGIV